MNRDYRDENLRSSEVDRMLLCSDDSEVEDVSDPESAGNYSDPESSNDSDSSSLFGDDTDEDPDFVPEINSVPRSQFQLPSRGSGRPRRRGRVGYFIRLRGRAARNIRVVTNANQLDPVEEGEDAENDWVEIEDGDDMPYLPLNSDQTFDFLEQPGPKHCPPPDAKPISYFNLFFTTAILELISKETNRFAQQYLTQNLMNLSLRNKFRSWKSTSIAEIRAFLIVMLAMGLVKKPTIKSYWTTTLSQFTPWFGRMFSRNRFESIYTFMHLVNNESLPKLNEPGYDPTAKFAPLINHANAVSKYHYTPHEYISVDESLVGTKNHTQLLQYLPKKHHHKWGVKLWMLCDSVTNYCLGFTCYRGAREPDRDQIKERGLGFVVVTKLLEMCNYLNKGYHVICDNFFTSVPLVRHLFDNKTFYTGTIRKIRKHLPGQIKQKFHVGQKSYFRKNQLLLLGYREKSSQRGPVCLLSSKAQAKDVEKTKILGRNREKVITKPQIIRQYNDFMGGIDSSDMMLYTYSDERRSVKYWKKVVTNIIGRMVLNSYILYKLNCTGKPLTRYQYMVSVIEDVSDDWLRSQADPGYVAGPSNNGSGDKPMIGEGLFKLPGTKERCCAVCSKKSLQQGGKMKKSRTACVKCQKGLHGMCYPYHIC